jgi:hypothetical protein
MLGDYQYDHDRDCDIVIGHLFDGLINDLCDILAARTKINIASFYPSFFTEYAQHGVMLYEKHLGSILKEINLKAEKINKIGKYGFSENWFQRMFIERVKEHVTDKSSWRFYFPECEEGIFTSPAHIAVKEFLNP